MSWLWHMMRPWAMPVLRLRLRIRVRGARNVPKKGAAILASNHLSALDHVVLPAVTPRTIHNISKKEHFEHPVRAWFFRHWGVIPLRRGAGDQAALEEAKKVLAQGRLFCIYPEGTRSPDGRLYKGHTGVARLALEMRVPVVPVAMVGTFEAKPKGHKGIRRGARTRAVVGEPLDFSAHWGKQDDRKVCRMVTDEVMAAIQRLSGQEYVDAYAPNPAYARGRRKAEALRAEAQAKAEEAARAETAAEATEDAAAKARREEAKAAEVKATEAAIAAAEAKLAEAEAELEEAEARPVDAEAKRPPAKTATDAAEGKARGK